MEWIRFTKRTCDPKLAWLERKLAEKGIASRRNGKSFHAPILEVDANKFDEAWSILSIDIDNKDDNDPMFYGE